MNYNRAILVGNVGSPPEVRSTTDGTRVATVSLATSEKWSDNKGQQREKTEWHRLVFWNSAKRELASLAERYISKGDKILVEGKIRYRTWDDAKGETKHSTEIEVTQVVFLSPRRAEQPPHPAEADDAPAGGV